MDSNSWLKIAGQKLKKAGISSPRLDGLILLEDELGIDRSYLLAEPRPISSSELTKLNKKLEQRMQHRPLSFIRQKTEFFGRQFFINDSVLEPRPESETMIELLKLMIDDTGRSSFYAVRELAKNSVPKANTLEQIIIADIGTGSGALAITAKLELPQAEIIAVDIDPGCLKTAKKNARNLNADIKFIRGDLINPVKNYNPGILLANLPYVPDRYKLNPSARFEPRLAIFGGKDGLDIYRNMFEQIIELKQKPLHIFTESLPFQHQALAEIASRAGYRPAAQQDLIYCFKYS